MDVAINCTETKNRMMVGSRDRIMKARTSLVLSLTPMMFFFRSNRSLTRLRTVRKSRRSSRITLMLMRAKIRILLEKGKSRPRSKTLVPR